MKSYLVLFILIILSCFGYGQQVTCYSNIDNHELKTRLISAQNLEFWPTIHNTVIVENEQLKQDTIILYIVVKMQPTAYAQFIRATSTSCLKKFVEVEYPEVCNEDEISLSINHYDIFTRVITVYCREKFHCRINLPKE